ncbi:hypothetical protein CA51_31250 [Rosistilla oblonga]|nr:hypothetical protein CA51_31250 [Rosistilla oblonga]
MLLEDRRFLLLMRCASCDRTRSSAFSSSRKDAVVVFFRLTAIPFNEGASDRRKNWRRDVVDGIAFNRVPSGPRASAIGVSVYDHPDSSPDLLIGPRTLQRRGATPARLNKNEWTLHQRLSSLGASHYNSWKGSLRGSICVRIRGIIAAGTWQLNQKRLVWTFR